MLFNSLHFLVFFPLVCMIYYVLQSLKARNFFLLVASYYFYMNWEPVYALLLLSSTVVTYAAGIFIARNQEARNKKIILSLCVVFNIGILFLFKYYNFIAENIVVFMRYADISCEMPKFTLLLPVGISFYIFQAVGYSIDVYRDATNAERNFFKYALFVSFFPQLVAGPIERSTNLLKQFNTLHRFSYDNFMKGLNWMVWGYFLKLVLADRCGMYVDAVFNNLDHHNGSSYLLAALLFPFQIYGDFFGYSLIAIGVARIMGFRLMDNFRRPYFAQTVTDFWHRWHISLSTWFKDYVYIPLGGNRVSKSRNYFNLMTTFIISGIWHGANWTFIVWGTTHGALQCAEKRLGWHKSNWKGWRSWWHWALTFAVVCLAWIFFRAESIGDAAHIIAGIFTRPGVPYLRVADLIIIFLTLAIVVAKEYKDEHGYDFSLSNSRHWIVRHLYVVFFVAFILLFGVLDGGQFIYFQF